MMHIHFVWNLFFAFCVILTASILQTNTAFSQTANQCEELPIDVKADNSDLSKGLKYERKAENNNLNKELIITLEEGTQVNGNNRTGIEIISNGPCDVTLKTADPTTVIVGGKGKDGIYVTDFDVGVDTKTITIDVGDVTSGDPDSSGEGGQGISVLNVRGNVFIRSDGTISTSGDLSDEISNGAVHLRLIADEVSNVQETNINVHNVSSHSTNPGGFGGGGIMVYGPGNVLITSTGLIETLHDYIPAVYVTLLDSEANDPGSVKINVNDVITDGTNSHALRVIHYHDEPKKVIPVKFTVGGDVLTRGDSAHGVMALGASLKVEVEVQKGGSITVEKPDDVPQTGDNPLPGSKAVYLIESPDTSVHSAIINNYGTINGGIDIESCMAPELFNYGRFNPAQVVNLIYSSGACFEDRGTLTSGRIVNSGIVSPGGLGTIATSIMKTDFEQSMLGTLEIDVDWSNETADLIDLRTESGKGGSATLNGILDINHLKLYTPKQLADFDEDEELTVTVFKTENGIQGQPKVNFANSLLLPRGVRKTNDDKNLILWSSPQKTLEELNQNQNNVLQDILLGYGSNETIFSLYSKMIEETKLSNLKFELDGLANEIAGASIQSRIRSGYDFIQSEPICEFKHFNENQANVCPNYKYMSSRQTRKHSFEELGHSTNSRSSVLATQFSITALDAGLEVSLGMEDSTTVIPRFASSNVRLLNVGLKLFGSVGPVKYRLAAGQSTGNHKISRQVPFNQLESKGEMRVVNQLFDLEASTQTELGNVLLSPFVGIGLAKYSSRAYQETGAQDLSLKVNASKGRGLQTRAGIKVKLAPLQFSLLDIIPEFKLTYHQSSSRLIPIDSHLVGGQNLIRSTTSILPSGYQGTFGAVFTSKSGRLSGHTGISFGRGYGQQSTQTTGIVGLTYQF